ncbi:MULTISPECIES: tRNA-dihydrouridine synthase [unclassified Campylobacter]|uniref:oxidoreductase n=1 Tax=unclassified Campylobacter TaxID=2593542 RepID=UPI003D33804C
MSRLFDPINFGNITLKNRVIMPPMCTYKVPDDSGMVQEFHKIHYGARALGGTGAIIVEATAVQAVGRITQKDLGLWDDAQISGHKDIANIIKSYGARAGIQLAHAGRKSEIDGSVSVGDEAFSKSYKAPKKLSLDEILSLKQDFIKAAKRAQMAGYEFVEIHAAHGYLLNTFLSKILNKRDDIYSKDRVRLVCEIVADIKAQTSLVVGVRLSASAWSKDDYSVSECANYAKALEDAGAEFIHVSSGGVHEICDDMPTITPLYQAGYAKQIKQAVSVPVIAVGLITKASEGEALLLGDVCDAVAYGRAMLDNANLAFRLASELKEPENIDFTYCRAY